jgi:hypothetical protein
MSHRRTRNDDAGVVTCAAVDIHDRGSFARGCGLVTVGVLVSCAAAFAQSSSSSLDLLPALVEKIASAIAPGTAVSLTPLASAMEQDADRSVEREIARLLTARGLRVVADGAPGAVSIVGGCGENLRERSCVAEIRRGETRDIVSAVRPHDTGLPGSVGRAIHSMAIEMTPLFAQRAPILDVLSLDDRLYVLDPARLTVYRRSQDDWQSVTARAIEPSRAWPRDARGRLRLTGSTLEAFLPGVVCRTSPDLTNLSCADQREAWPLAIENAGLDALRNTFQTPEGTPFFSAAALAPESGARTALVTATHALVLMDERRTAVGSAGTADDVASVAAACASGMYLVTTSATPGARTDTLHLARVDARRATPSATPIVLPGRVTALWSVPGATVATAIVRDLDVERHEAFQVRLSCDR